MELRLVFLILTLCTTTTMSFSQNLEIPGSYHWENRVLLIFSSKESQKQQEQIAVFENHQDGLRERDLVIF